MGALAPEARRDGDDLDTRLERVQRDRHGRDRRPDLGDDAWLQAARHGRPDEGVGGLIGKQRGCVQRLAGGRPLAHLRLDQWRAFVVECEDDEEVRVQDDAQAPRA